MSQPNASVQRGLAGIKGLSFAYRLNTWGPKVGPPMIPANAYPSALVPAQAPSLSGFFTAIEGMLGVEAPADMVTDAANILNSATSQLTGAQTTIQNLLSQAQAYNSSSDQNVLAKASACESEAAGLIASLQSLQQAAATLQNSVTLAQGNTGIDKPTAQALKDSTSAYSDQVDTFTSGMSQLQKDISALASAAQSGPGLTGSIANTVASSVSTLTWIVGGGLMVYLLAPTFIPRLAGGIRKARSS